MNSSASEALGGCSDVVGVRMFYVVLAHRLAPIYKAAMGPSIVLQSRRYRLLMLKRFLGGLFAKLVTFQPPILSIEIKFTGSGDLEWNSTKCG